jgi:hypothetical protein
MICKKCSGAKTVFYTTLYGGGLACPTCEEPDPSLNEEWIEDVKAHNELCPSLLCIDSNCQDCCRCELIEQVRFSVTEQCIAAIENLPPIADGVKKTESGEVDLEAVTRTWRYTADFAVRAIRGLQDPE